MGAWLVRVGATLGLVCGVGWFFGGLYRSGQAAWDDGGAQWQSALESAAGAIVFGLAVLAFQLEHVAEAVEGLRADLAARDGRGVADQGQGSPAAPAVVQPGCADQETAARGTFPWPWVRCDCGHDLAWSARVAGKRVKCPKCGAAVVMPAG